MNQKNKLFEKFWPVCLGDSSLINLTNEEECLVCGKKEKKHVVAERNETDGFTIIDVYQIKIDNDSLYQGSLDMLLNKKDRDIIRMYRPKNTVGLELKHVYLCEKCIDKIGKKNHSQKITSKGLYQSILRNKDEIQKKNPDINLEREMNTIMKYFINKAGYKSINFHFKPDKSCSLL